VSNEQGAPDNRAQKRSPRNAQVANKGVSYHSCALAGRATGFRMPCCRISFMPSTLDLPPWSFRVRTQGPALESNAELSLRSSIKVPWSSTAPLKSNTAGRMGLNHMDLTDTPDVRTGARTLQTGWPMLRSERAPHIRGQLGHVDSSSGLWHHLLSEGFPTRLPGFSEQSRYDALEKGCLPRRTILH